MVPTPLPTRTYPPPWACPTRDQIEQLRYKFGRGRGTLEGLVHTCHCVPPDCLVDLADNLRSALHAQQIQDHLRHDLIRSIGALRAIVLLHLFELRVGGLAHVEV